MERLSRLVLCRSVVGRRAAVVTSQQRRRREVASRAEPRAERRRRQRIQINIQILRTEHNNDHKVNIAAGCDPPARAATLTTSSCNTQAET
ncbi:unnamed protein product [Chrysodeixis includens]|uniref:Uncharacterized protein n=1 Tax=Chrysodeixis includens TaxID=689277 RepID=A0A9N8Q1Y6_CHRIL|nr:unnamed protein product [Chrysodeixis includens]